ncbi:hypothetical protein D030_4118A, partial [Vibrio parahaemolyticus AQ3810]
MDRPIQVGLNPSPS